MNRRDLFKMFSGVAGIPAVAAIEKLELKPGDTIVLKFKDHLPQYAAARIDDVMAQKFPGHKILILDNGADINIVVNK